MRTLYVGKAHPGAMFILEKDDSLILVQPSGVVMKIRVVLRPLSDKSVDAVARLVVQSSGGEETIAEGTLRDMEALKAALAAKLPGRRGLRGWIGFSLPLLAGAACGASALLAFLVFSSLPPSRPAQTSTLPLSTFNPAAKTAQTPPDALGDLASKLSALAGGQPIAPPKPVPVLPPRDIKVDHPSVPADAKPPVANFSQPTVPVPLTKDPSGGKFSDGQTSVHVISSKTPSSEVRLVEPPPSPPAPGAVPPMAVPPPQPNPETAPSSPLGVAPAGVDSRGATMKNATPAPVSAVTRLPPVFIDQLPTDQYGIPDIPAQDSWAAMGGTIHLPPIGGGQNIKGVEDLERFGLHFFAPSHD